MPAIIFTVKVSLPADQIKVIQERGPGGPYDCPGFSDICFAIGQRTEQEFRQQGWDARHVDTTAELE
jgi:hypothetical protein